MKAVCTGCAMPLTNEEITEAVRDLDQQLIVEGEIYHGDCADAARDDLQAQAKEDRWAVYMRQSEEYDAAKARRES